MPILEFTHLYIQSPKNITAPENLELFEAALKFEGYPVNFETTINYYRLKPVVWFTLAKQIKSVNAKTLIF